MKPLLSTLVAAVMASATSQQVTASSEVLPFIENDYAAALSAARSKHLPLFADAWAPW